MPGSDAYQATFNTTSNDTTSSVKTSIETTSSLHTISSCSIQTVGKQTGEQQSTKCSAAAEGNIGCGVSLGEGTFGNGWNNAGGGKYVIWRDYAAFVQSDPFHRIG